MKFFRIVRTTTEKDELYVEAETVDEARMKATHFEYDDSWNNASKNISYIIGSKYENLAVTRWGQAGPDCSIVPEGVRLVA